MMIQQTKVYLYFFYHILLLNIIFYFIGTVSELEQKLKQLKIANQKLARNSRGSNLSESDESANVEETSSFKTVADGKSNSSKPNLKITLYTFLFTLLYIINCVII